MDLEHTADVVGAAIGQRKISSDSGLAQLHALVRPFRADTEQHPSEVAQNVGKLAEELRYRVRVKRAPVEVPSATLGRRLIRIGSTGSRETWRAGTGAAALSQMTHAEMEAGAPGFGAREAFTLRRVLVALAQRTV